MDTAFPCLGLSFNTNGKGAWKGKSNLASRPVREGHQIFAVMKLFQLLVAYLTTSNFLEQNRRSANIYKYFRLHSSITAPMSSLWFLLAILATWQSYHLTEAYNGPMQLSPKGEGICKCSYVNCYWCNYRTYECRLERDVRGSTSWKFSGYPQLSQRSHCRNDKMT